MEQVNEATGNVISLLVETNEKLTYIADRQDFFLFTFIPVLIAVILLVFGCRWFYRTFISPSL